MDETKLIGLANEVRQRRIKKQKEEERRKEAERKKRIKDQALSVCKDILERWTEDDDGVVVWDINGKIVIELEPGQEITTNIDYTGEIIQEIVDFFEKCGYKIGYMPYIFIQIVS